VRHRLWKELGLYSKEQEDHKVEVDKMLAEGTAEEWHIKNRVRTDQVVMKSWTYTISLRGKWQRSPQRWLLIRRLVSPPLWLSYAILW
jgi:hypothetical protein